MAPGRAQRAAIASLYSPVRDELTRCGLPRPVAERAARRVVLRLDEELPRTGSRLAAASRHRLVATVRYQQYKRQLAQARATALATVLARLLGALDVTGQPGPGVAAAAGKAREALEGADALTSADAAIARTARPAGSERAGH